MREEDKERKKERERQRERKRERERKIIKTPAVYALESLLIAKTTRSVFGGKMTVDNFMTRHNFKSVFKIPFSNT